MPVELLEDPIGTPVLRLAGEYTLFEIEQALQAGIAPGRALTVDFSRAQMDHSAFELERLASLLAAVSATLTLRTRDVLRFGFARTIMGYCSSKGVNVRIDHSAH